MKKRHLFYVMLPLAAFVLGACSDELEGSKRYDDGFLHFNLQFNNQKSQWTENGSGSNTRMDVQLTLTSKDVEGLTLYLHVEESDIIETPQTAEVTTRGERLTGEVFPGIGSFGLYGKVGANVVTHNDDTDYWNFAFTSDDVANAEGFFEKEYEFQPDGTFWGAADKGNFYAYAPTNATNVTPSPSGPTLNYEMPVSEAAQLDVLAAKKENVSRDEKNSDGIKLQFQHVLSAVKFKISDTENNKGVFKAVVHDQAAPNDATKGKTYYLKVKGIQVKGVYSMGTLHFGEVSVSDNTTIIEDLGYWQRTDVIGNCMVDVTNTGYSKADPLLNTDDHCLMMLPQRVPDGAKVVLQCDMSSDGTDENVYAEDVTFEVSLAGLDWEPGHSYTYTITDSDLIRILDISPSTLAFPLINGEGETTTKKSIQTITVKSFFATKKSGENPNYSDETIGIPAPWHPQYSEDGGTTWVDGLPQGYVLLDSEGNPIEDLENIPGSVTGQEYKLEALTRSEKSDVISALLTNKPGGYGTKNAPVDLSLYNTRATGSAAGQAWPGGRNTANCYIINGYGYFKFPLVYGNAIKNGETNKWAFTELDQYKIYVNYLDQPIQNSNILTDVYLSSTEVEPFLVWQDEKNVVKLNSTLTQEDGLTFINFSVPKEYVKSGNALIAIREKSGSKRIIWSWHIWVFDAEYDSTVEVKNTSGTRSLDFTKYNLGWRIPERKEYMSKTTNIRIAQNGSDNAYSTTGTAATQDGGVVEISGSNLYFQFGRKDPMPACYMKKNLNNNNYTRQDMAVDIWNLGYCKKEYTGDTKNWWTNDGHIQGPATDTPATMGKAIQTPYYLYSSGEHDWMKATDGNRATYDYAGRWDPEKAGNYGTGRDMTETEYNSFSATYPASAYSHIKTIYDPCPYGYAVPPCNAYGLMLFEWKTATSSATVYGLGTTTITGPTGSLDFPESGWRISGGGAIATFNDNGYCWTAGAQNDGNGFDEAWYLETAGTGTKMRAFCRNHTSPVRATRDNEIERIAVLGDDFTIHDGGVDAGTSFSRRK